MLTLPGDVADVTPSTTTATTAEEEGPAESPVASPVVPHVQVEGFITHVVLPSDTLAGLALRYNCTEQEIQLANHTTSRKIFGFKELLIPDTRSGASGKGMTRTRGSSFNRALREELCVICSTPVLDPVEVEGSPHLVPEDNSTVSPRVEKTTKTIVFDDNESASASGTTAAASAVVAAVLSSSGGRRRRRGSFLLPSAKRELDIRHGTVIGPRIPVHVGCMVCPGGAGEECSELLGAWSDERITRECFLVDDHLYCQEHGPVVNICSNHGKGWGPNECQNKACRGINSVCVPSCQRCAFVSAGKLPECDGSHGVMFPGLSGPGCGNENCRNRPYCVPTCEACPCRGTGTSIVESPAPDRRGLNAAEDPAAAQTALLTREFAEALVARAEPLAGDEFDVAGIHVNVRAIFASATRPWLLNFNRNPKNWIWKEGDDLRKDALCLRVMDAMNSVWRKWKLPVRCHTYRVTPFLIEETHCGFIEALNGAPLQDQPVDSYSVLTGAKEMGNRGNRFVATLNGTIIASYVFDLYDRHHGNVFLDASGAISHIDFNNCFGLQTRFEPAPKVWCTLRARRTAHYFGYSTSMIAEACSKGYRALTERDCREEVLTAFDVAAQEVGLDKDTVQPWRHYLEAVLTEDHAQKFAAQVQSSLTTAKYQFGRIMRDNVQNLKAAFS